MTNRSRRPFLLAAAAAAALTPLALTGCQQPRDPSPIAGQPDPIMAPLNNPRIRVGQTDLQGVLGFDAPVVRRENGLLVVTVPMRNLENARYLVDYRFVFYDENGAEVRPQMGYRELWLEAKEQRRLTANAVDTSAVDWRFDVKWANR